MNKANLDRELQQFFASRNDVAAVYLFGSRARGKKRSTSDIDVAVLFDADPPNTLEGLHLDLEGELEQRLREPVDLTVLNLAPPDLTHRILRDGHLLVDRNPSKRIRFEVRARNEYFDLEPILRRYRQPRKKSS